VGIAAGQSVPVAPALPDAENPFEAALSRAVAAGALTEGQAKVIAARRANPKLTWPAIAESLGMKPSACAVAHHRGMNELRVHLFLLNEPDLIGGPDAIVRAFDSASQRIDHNANDTLTPHEAAIVRRLVIDRLPPPHPRDWRAVLRVACTKVTNYLAKPQ
jgi:hypothetical protein